MVLRPRRGQAAGEYGEPERGAGDASTRTKRGAGERQAGFCLDPAIVDLALQKRTRPSAGNTGNRNGGRATQAQEQSGEPGRGKSGFCLDPAIVDLAVQKRTRPSAGNTGNRNGRAGDASTRTKRGAGERQAGFYLDPAIVDLAVQKRTRPSAGNTGAGGAGKTERRPPYPAFARMQGAVCRLFLCGCPLFLYFRIGLSFSREIMYNKGNGYVTITMIIKNRPKVKPSRKKADDAAGKKQTARPGKHIAREAPGGKESGAHRRTARE